MCLCCYPQVSQPEVTRWVDWWKDNKSRHVAYFPYSAAHGGKNVEQVMTSVLQGVLTNEKTKGSKQSSRTSEQMSRTSEQSSRSSGQASRTSGQASRTSGQASRIRGQVSWASERASRTSEQASMTKMRYKSKPSLICVNNHLEE